jgi:hypothetical protein
MMDTKLPQVSERLRGLGVCGGHEVRAGAGWARGGARDCWARGRLGCDCCGGVVSHAEEGFGARVARGVIPGVAARYQQIRRGAGSKIYLSLF